MFRSFIFFTVSSCLSMSCFAQSGPLGENWDKFWDSPDQTPAPIFLKMCESIENSISSTLSAQADTDQPTKNKLRYLEDLLIEQYDEICAPVISVFNNKHDFCQALYIETPEPILDITTGSIQEYKNAQNKYYGAFVDAGCYAVYITFR